MSRRLRVIEGWLYHPMRESEYPYSMYLPKHVRALNDQHIGHSNQWSMLRKALEYNAFHLFFPKLGFI